MRRIRFPYGEANFGKIRENGLLFIDKTRYIEVLEQEPDYQFFIRPRRFGKSLFISMLENYYDINKKDKFETLFGDLYIGKNPTPSKNSYLVLTLDFSGLVTDQGRERFYESLNGMVVSKVTFILEKYQRLLGSVKVTEEEKKADLILDCLMNALIRSNQKILILIDEYDNFANDLITYSTQAKKGNKEAELSYEELVHADGYVRSFYKKLKVLARSCNTRIFMTGVSPIMLDDMASGFNITTNLTTNPKLNEMLGFTEDEVVSIMDQLVMDSTKKAIVLSDLRFYYNGYLFSEEADIKIFNSDMILYFFNDYQSFGRYPKQILDNNVKTDYRKIQALAFNFKDDGTMEQLLKHESIEVELADRFPLEKMYSNKENFKSLLFYLGMLTINRGEEDKVILQIPNYVVHTIYWEYFYAQLQEDIEIDTDYKPPMKAMRLQGDIYPFVEYVKDIIEKLSNRDLQKFDEKYLKVVLMVLFDLDGIFLIQSESEARNGYIDLLLTRSRQYAQYVTYEWMLEIKYLKESERHKLQEVMEAGKTQLQKYAESEDIKSRFEDDTFKRAVLIFIGKGDIVVEEVQ